MSNDMKPHKFYVIELVPKKYKMRDYNHVLVKFGITSNMDVLQRFNPYFDERYKDFEYKVKFSKRFSNKAKAERIEQFWLGDRGFPNPGPNKVWLERYLKCKNNHEYDNTGITEIRLLSRPQLSGVLTVLYNSLTHIDKQLKEEAKKYYV
tara:strand:+ start:498 stop:947 length:450 start_codon:yes stop_codon:yes gene_type:complete